MLGTTMVLAIMCATVEGNAPARADGGPAAAQSSGPILPSGTRSRQTPAVRDVPPVGSQNSPTAVPRSTDNSAAPPSTDKTTEPRNVDRGGSPRTTSDRGAAPQQMSDVPLSPPVAPPAEEAPNRAGGGPDRVNDIHAAPGK